MSSDYTTAVEVISALAVVANCILLFLSVRGSSISGDHSKYLLFMTPVMDLAHAMCYLLIAPIPHSRDFTFLWVSTGALSTVWPSGMFFVAFLCASTISSLLLVGNNFLYRYITLCWNRFSYIYSSTKFLVIGGVINLLLVANWLAMIYFALWPSDAVVAAAHYAWNGQMDLVNKVYIGFTSREGADPFKLAILIESLVMIFTLSQLSPFCAMRIHRCLKHNSLSDRTKEIQKKMLILLSIQIACPTLLMHLPLVIMFLLVFTGLTSSVFIEYFVGVAMALDPLFGPVVTILFVKDYRKKVLTTLHIAKRSHASILPAITTIRSPSTQK